MSKKYCTEVDLERALQLQKAGDGRMIGRILVDMGAVTWDQIDDAVKTTAAQSE